LASINTVNRNLARLQLGFLTYYKPIYVTICRQVTHLGMYPAVT